ncbi:MAG: hypothetical protein WCN92_09105 [Eubacteriales bacterium]
MKFMVLLSKIKYEIAIFAVLLVQMAIRINWANPIETNYLSFYLLDYKVGFVSRAFIGSIVALLTKQATVKWLTGFIILSFVFVYFILTLILGKLIRGTTGDTKNIVVFLVAVFLFASFSIRIFVQSIGMLDIYWFLFALLIMICLKNKFSKWFIPLLCLFGLATHYSFAFSFLPFTIVLIFYEAYKAKSKISSIFLAAISFFVSVCATVYFVFFSNSQIKLTSDGLYSYLSKKADFHVWRYFFDGYLFYTDLYSGKKVEGFSGFLEVLKTTAFESMRFSNFFTSLCLTLPLIVLFFCIWKRAYRLSQKKGEKFIILLCIMLPLPVLPSFILSTDLPRFLGEILIVQFLMLFYMLIDKNETIIAILKRTEGFFKKYPVMLILIFVLSLSAYYYK